MQERRARCQGLVERRGERQLFVLHPDHVGGGLGGGLVLRRDGGDGLTGEADPIAGDDRTILDRVTPVPIEIDEIRSGEHTDDSGHGLGLPRVHGYDAGMRERGAQHLPVQHARHDHVADELGLPAELLLRVLARRGVADWANGHAARSR